MKQLSNPETFELSKANSPKQLSELSEEIVNLLHSSKIEEEKVLYKSLQKEVNDLYLELDKVKDTFSLSIPKN